jgi:hypothetical protein
MSSRPYFCAADLVMRTPLGKYRSGSSRTSASCISALPHSTGTLAMVARSSS